LTTDVKTKPDAESPVHATKQRLIGAGMQMLLKHGYNDTGIQALLATTGTPKGSFYHHFRDKEDFALQVLDTYMSGVHDGLDACLQDETRPPLERVRNFFETTQKSYREEGYMGCLIGGLGQELSGISEVFRHRIAACFSFIAERIAGCLEEARQVGDIPANCNAREMADLLVDCWEGAALRSRLERKPDALNTMLDFYMGAVAARGPVAASSLAVSPTADDPKP
jgi:TetR/AcrR family transcriptional regulator, transcriptional repressor for nem operon